MKFTVIYFSKDGHTKEMADEVVKGASKVKKIEAKAFSLDEIDKDFVDESKCVVFGTPVYHAGICWQMKKWFNEESKDYNLEGKLGGAFATAAFVQGGLNTACLELTQLMLVKGIMVYSSGSALGQPFLHIGATSINENSERDKMQFISLGERLANKVVNIFND
ncbi:MAG TPA: NAD(P)H-dependent oxidoreductase [Anaerovoracaceae bacterium]|nr:NAD(P)H-dependent oxidoreductase [Anaerovoracaceae bacterium]